MDFYIPGVPSYKMSQHDEWRIPISNMTLNEFFNVKPDPRTLDWPLVANPLYTLGICLTYVYSVKVIGPKLMENRKPFQLKWTLVTYNLLQVLFSTWLFYEIGMSGWFTGEYSLRCQPVDYSNKPSTIRMTYASWWYFFSKFTEFFDTVFFILRKKFDHVSTLHVIHHGIMPMSVWFGVKYTPGGHSTFFGLLNTFVHIVMYFYYMLAAFGPQVQKHLWWKKYLTTFQMVQFVAIMAHSFQLFFTSCNYPQAFAWWIGMHATLFLYLFKEYYDRTYKAAKAKKALEYEKLLNGNMANGKHLNGEVLNGKMLNGSVSNGKLINGDAHNGKVDGIQDNNHVYNNGTANAISKQNGYAKANGVNGNIELHHRTKGE